MRRCTYRPFEVAGLELEYAVVDGSLRPRCLVEPAFRQIAGRPVSEVAYDDVAFSNELAAHVFEVKTRQPERYFEKAENDLFAGVQYFSSVLRQEFGALLLPTGMHPFMRPAETSLWSRAGRHTYEAYARIFPIHQHGWLNVQSCQVNLPFGTEGETVLLHNAAAAILPYLPAIAASSPIYGGALGPCVDNRLAFYRTNQQRIPQITGQVIPEFMTSYQQYRSDILRPMYRAIRRFKGGERLAHEWLNSRGAILRFKRRAIEIRVLDSQECVKMDVAIAVFVRGVLKWTFKQLRQGSMQLPTHRMLVGDFAAVVKAGTDAAVHATHLRGSGVTTETVAVRSILSKLLERAESETPSAERIYLRLVGRRAEDGNLSEHIRAAVQDSRARGPAGRRATLTAIYGELVECLERNTPWEC